MARQNNIPKGAGPHLRSPNAAHDASAPGQAYGSAYPHQQYDPHQADEQPALPPAEVPPALPETGQGAHGRWNGPDGSWSRR